MKGTGANLFSEENGPDTFKFKCPSDGGIKMKFTSKLIVFIFTLWALTTSTQAQSPREQLNQMVQQLQQTPNDHALREKIIQLATTLKPPSAIPEQAREPFVMGATVLKRSGDPAGAAKAVDLFTQALNIAPWFADAYYNRAVAREIAGQFEPAIDDLKLYLEFKLTDSERRQAQDKIYALKADAQLVSSKKTEQAREAAKADSRLVGTWTTMYEGRIAMIDTRRHADWSISAVGPGRYAGRLTLFGRDYLVLEGFRTFTFSLNGDRVEGTATWNGKSVDAKYICDPITSNMTGTLSADGKVLNMKHQSRSEMGCRIVSEETNLMRLQ